MSKVLGNVDAVTAVAQSNGVLVEVGGRVKRITVANLVNSVNAGDTGLLNANAWGVEIKQNASGQQWTLVGSRELWNAYKRQCGRYLLTNAGLAAKLRADNSGYYADGTAVDETKGHVFCRFPRLYFRVVTDSTTGVPTLWMSQSPIGGRYIEESWIGAYKGYKNGTALVSRSGYAPSGTMNINAFWTAAQVNGTKFGLVNYDHRRLLMMMQLSEYGNPNAQTQVGYGLCGSSSNADGWTNTASLLTGATKSLGDATGKIDVSVTGGTDCSRVNFFGVEDPWGWQWEMTQGVYFGSENNEHQDGEEIYIYAGNRMPSATELADEPLGDYRILSDGRKMVNGYVKEMIIGDEFDLFPLTQGGGGTSYWGDSSWNGTAQGTNPETYKLTGQLLLWGGSAINGSYCGLGSSNSNHGWSHSHASLGSRLAFYGTPAIVDGKQI